MSSFHSNVRSNADRVLANMGLVRREVAEQAMPIALNKMIAQVKTAAAVRIRDTGYKLKAATIKRGLNIRRAYAGKLTASVIASGRPIPLSEYGARQTKRGASVDVLKGRKVIAHAFVATMPSGHKAVLVRQAGGKHKKVSKGGRTRWSALPIRELFGPGIPDALANEEVQRVLQSFIEDKFPQVFRHEVSRLSSKG